jgi:hypothetical protein
VSQKPDLSDYIDVPARIAEFRGKYPDGSLQPWDQAAPYRIETIGGETYIAVVAAAYRTPDDPKPGVGMAYEVFPGKTPYTKGSELQNAETSAWGRAIVATLAADTRQIASADEVRNRREEQAALAAADIARNEVLQAAQSAGVSPGDVAARWLAEQGHPIQAATDVPALMALAAALQGAKAA